MARYTIAKLTLTRHAVDRAAQYGLALIAFEEVLVNRFVLVRNRGHRAASHLLIGRTHHGECLVVPVVATDDSLVWRAISVWPCDRAAAARLP